MKKLLLILGIALLLAVSHTAGAASTEPKLNDTLELKGNYKLHLESIDISSLERSAVLQLRHGGVLDEKVVMSGDAFSLYDGQALILNGTLASVFSGATGNLISIRDLVQYDKETGAVILALDRVNLFIPTHPTVNSKPPTASIDLKQGYELTLMAADDNSDPKQIWLQFTRGGETIDERIVSLGDSFSFYDGNSLIANARFSQIFQGAQGLMVQIMDLNQYNRNTGEPILYFDRVILEV
jgi:hypothetical protein